MTADRTGQSVLAVVGPTATGKSALAARIARDYGGEIVSADSRQVYRQMDIGTAKPPAADLAAAPHHLIDIVGPDEEYSLARYLRQAREAIEEVLSRSRLPIVVGGSGQYVWALLEGWQVPEVQPDRELRAELEAKVSTDGARALHQQLALLDPEAASRVDPANPRRVVRALEVLQSSSPSGASPKQKPPSFGQVVIGLTLDRPTLYARIEGRVDAMIEQGLVNEVKALLKRGYGLNLPSMSGIGYSEIAAYLAGRGTLDEATAEIKRRTRKLARQQYNWFRLEDERIRWFQGTTTGLNEAAEWAGEQLTRVDGTVKKSPNNEGSRLTRKGAMEAS